MRETENRHHDLEVIAGHCSVNPERISELYEMSEIQVVNRRGKLERALSAVRFVGLKSRTNHNPTGDGMGMDFDVIERAIMFGPSDEVPPTVLLAQEFVRETGMGIASEIVNPGIQLPFYESRIPKGQFIPWNPAIDQSGWSVRQMAEIASRNDWTIGIKNGKWLGVPLAQANQPDSEILTPMETTWQGLKSFAEDSNCNVVFIHRGVDVPEKGDYRNAPVHEVVKRLAKKFPNAGRFFDPSHIMGPKLRDDIVRTTIDAMRMTVGNEYLYTGILIETGTSKTDAEQHIAIDELKVMIWEISRFRAVGGPYLPTGGE